MLSDGTDGVRERVWEAMLDLVTAGGYQATGLETILERADISHEEFCRRFKDKEDCALQLTDRLFESFNKAVRDAYDRYSPWRDSMRACSYAAAKWMMDNPKGTRFGMVELLSAGELAQVRREAVFQSFVDLVDAARAELDDPLSVPPHTAERAIGSVVEILTNRLRGGPIDIYEPIPDLLYFVYRVYFGEEIAREELTMPPPPEYADDVQLRRQAYEEG